MGAWLIGATGGLATTLVVGARMIARGLVSDAGLLTETPAFRKLNLIGISEIVFGGHDIRGVGLYESAYEIHRETGTIDFERLLEIKEELETIDADIRTGTIVGAGPTIRRMATKEARRAKGPLSELLERLQEDLKAFKKRHRLDVVIVVNLASTERPLPSDPGHDDPQSFEALLEADEQGKIRASSLYAYAAVTTGCPFINFTPSMAALLPAIQKKARRKKLPVAGSDGKTGETLVKTALAPMFKYRNLKVLTWQGYNILGDRDGQVLADARHKQSKIRTKDAVLTSILGYPLHTHVGIDYVPSLNDLKTAWDFIHFQGFLDYKMSMQFTWQGCDAILAAPVVLDMIRLAVLAWECRESGLMTWLSCFFKSPLGVDEHDLHFQFHHLMDYVQAHLDGRPWKTGLVAAPGEIRLPRPVR